MTAKFITIEGIEGVGKSSVIDVICNCIKTASIDYVLTREPGGTSIAEGIREIILAQWDEPLMPLTEALLFFAGREQNITQVIKPALANDQWVVCDRFTDSSIAYQGGGRGVEQQRLQAMQQWVQGDLQPDMTILLDAPVEVGMARIQSRSKDRIESEKLAFFERARASYLELADKYSDHYRIINASQPIEQVQQDVVNVMREFIEQVT